MKLYGTTTSPFVRRVRVVAAEVGEPIDRVDTATDVGMAALREVSPIRKVPVAIVGEGDGKLLFDSRAIVAWLIETHGAHDFARSVDPWQEGNLVNAIDAALDSVIQLFYLRRDRVVVDGSSYTARQLDRADAIFGWVGPQLRRDAFGLPELSAICALDWMDFRQSYQTERAGLEPLRAAWRERPTLVATQPHA